jgi:hypothetical protein
MPPKHTKINFPLWQFLSQPLFDAKTKFILNPSRFWHLYKIQLLERCWAKECDSKDRHCGF